MKYDELVGELYLVASNVQSERRKNMLVQAAVAIQELTAALTASNEVIATQSRQLEEYRKYDSFLAAHGCFDSVEPPKEDVKDKCVNVNM